MANGIRKVVIDIETTHLEISKGKIIEIGCVELIDDYVTGKEFSTYIDPQMAISAETTKITGITDQTVAGKPIFAVIAQQLLDFIGNDIILAHNAQFDIAYLNKELAEIQYPILSNIVIDTLAIARRRFRQNNSLDALCSRFNIATHTREKHGAIIDARLLANLYFYLQHATGTIALQQEIDSFSPAVVYATVVYVNSDQDKELHIAFCKRHALTALDALQA